MRKLSLTFLLSLAFVILLAQQKQVGYTQLANDIFLNNKESVFYKNVHFVNDLPNKGAESFVTTYFTTPAPVIIYGGFKNYLESKNAGKDDAGLFKSTCRTVVIEDCTFDNDLRFSNASFNGLISLRNNNFPNRTEDYVGLYGQAFGGGILIDSCKFESMFELIFLEEHPYRLFYKFNNTVCNTFQVELQKSTSQINNSQFLGNAYLQLHDQGTVISIDNILVDGSWKVEFDDIKESSISNSQFTYTGDLQTNMYLNANSVTLENNRFRGETQISFEESRMFINENIFDQKLLLDFTGVGPSSYINLRSLKNLNFGTPVNHGYYDATTQDQINNDVAYKKYLRINKALYDHFKEVGDMKSANDTYVRIREIENIKLKYLYEEVPTFQNFFALNLNRLLRFYTNYGTDPAKALVISFYIIFVFGVFYFFFPSDWDITSKSRLLQNFKDFIQKNEKGYWRPLLTLLVGLLISIINATTLSLNAFTTLGFGNIPTHGLARYVCIVQGFIGWFLLSIFTVALINQAQF